MDDALMRLRREPPLFGYKGFNVVIFQNPKRCYEAYVDGHRVRAPDAIPLEFISYDTARACTERVIDSVLARRKALS